MTLLDQAGHALDQQRPAQAFEHLAQAVSAAREAQDAAAEEAALSLKSYCAWLIGDWTDMPTIIEDFRRARQLRIERFAQTPNRPSMRAAVAPAPGKLELADVPEPDPLPGFVKIRVKAVGLNRTEKRLADGGWPVTALSPVAPLVNGIECAGVVVDSGHALGGLPALPVGTRVLACASSLGRGIDGTHAEFVVVPRWGVVEIPDEGSALSWRELAAIPLSYATAAGSLDAMDCKHGDTVLVRGGTSALGLATIALAKHTLDCTVVATSRRSSAEARLRAAGADIVLIEPDIRTQIRRRFTDGVDCALEGIGETTLKETMHCVRRGGVMCQTGALAGVDGFGLHLLGEVPSGVKVTCFESDGLTHHVMDPLVGKLIAALRAGTITLAVDPTEFALEDYAEAMAFLDSPERKGKVVIEVPAAD